MPALSFDNAQLSVTIRTPGGAHSPPVIRTVVGEHRQQATRQLTVDGADATLAKVGGATWLTIPAGSTDGVAFDVQVDASALSAAGYFTETIRASADGFDAADCVVSLKVLPEGPKP